MLSRHNCGRRKLKRTVSTFTAHSLAGNRRFHSVTEDRVREPKCQTEPTTMIDKEGPDPSGDDPKSYDRRHWLTTSAAVAGAMIATGGARGQENLQHVRQAQHGKDASNPGPDNKPITSVQPDADVPPPTDQGNPPNFWSTFSAQH